MDEGSRFEDAALRLHRLLQERLWSWTTKSFVGFIGFVIGAIDHEELQRLLAGRFGPVFWDLFGKRALLFVAASVVPVLWGIEFLLRRRFSKERLSAVLSRFETRLPPDFTVRPEATHFFKIGGALTVVTVPDVLHGLPVSKVQLRILPTQGAFAVPASEQARYEAFVPTLGLKEGDPSDDGVKLMVSRIEIPRTDSPVVSIWLRRTKFSVVRYYQKQVLADRKAAFLDELQCRLDGGPDASLKIGHPHSICAHIILITGDDLILATRRSRSLSYYPATWSTSIEEQADEKDVSRNGSDFLSRWVERGLWEELHLSRSAEGRSEPNYDEEGIRLASVLCETDSLNVSLCVVVRLNIPSTEVDAAIRLGFTEDKEFTEWAFIGPREAANEIANNDRLHPTSKYRMIFGLIIGFNMTPIGVFRLVDRFIAKPQDVKLR